MTDFELSPPITIQQTALITEAMIEMRACGVHLLLVTNKQNQVVGLISSEDLLGNKPIQTAHEKGFSRNEIRVEMVMTPQKQVLTLNFEDLKYAKVGHIIKTLNENRQHYALVVKLQADDNQKIKGLFSLSQISKQIGTDLTRDKLIAENLAELQHQLK